MTEWYNLTEQERIKEVYGKFTIAQFWEWWSGGESKMMEVRIKDFPLIKETAKKLYLPYSASGVFVNSALKLKSVIAHCRDKAVIWFGVNPRKKNYNKFGSMQYGGTDYNVQSISFLFIDIDRLKKDGPATNKALENCDKLAKHILDKLSEAGFSNEYMKICSGNGIQLLIKLDIPITMPSVEYENKSKTFIDNEEFVKMKLLIRKGVGQLIYSYSKKFADELEVSVDTAGFRIAGVAALPFTKNYKYGGFTWRGIIEMSNGMNNGLSDYVLSKEENIDDFHTRINFTPPPIYRKFLAKKGSIEEHPLIKYALENEIPKGMRNNYMWFSIKMLLRDSNIDFASPEFKALHKKLEKRWNDELASNVPDKKFIFSETTVNQFCIKNKVALVYPYMAYRKKKQDMKLDDIGFQMMSITDKTMRLDINNEILDDMKDAKKTMIEGDYDNIIRMGAFIRGCIKKYGDETTAYYVKYLFPRFFNYE